MSRESCFFFGIFLLIFFNGLSPLCVNYLFIGKKSLLFPLNCLVPKQHKITLVSYFFSICTFGPFILIFCSFSFFVFLYFFEKDNMNINSIKLINDFEKSALKTKCVESKFLNF